MSTFRLSIVAAAILAAAALTISQTAGVRPRAARIPRSVRSASAPPTSSGRRLFRISARTARIAIVHVNPRPGHAGPDRAAKQAGPLALDTANEAIMVKKGILVECEGKKVDLGPGSFIYTPSRLIHRATFPRAA